MYICIGLGLCLSYKLEKHVNFPFIQGGFWFTIDSLALGINICD